MTTKKNVLIVNSDIELNGRVSKLLFSEDTNWNIFTVFSGKECLDIVNNGNCPDVIILGMKLSDTTGLQLTERIRDYSDVPIILLANDREIYTLVKAFDSGVNDYITLPFNEKIFIARLKALIRRSSWDKNIQKESTELIA
jgi:DNA-binding response OmpR family regulator